MSSLFAELTKTLSDHQARQVELKREREASKRAAHKKRMAAVDREARARADELIGKVRENALRRQAGGGVAGVNEGDDELDREYAEAVRDRTRRYLIQSFEDDADKFRVTYYEVRHDGFHDSDSGQSYPASTSLCIGIEW